VQTLSLKIVYWHLAMGTRIMKSKPQEDVAKKPAELGLRLREQTDLLPPGSLRDEVLRKARQAGVVARLDGWLRSPGLRPPE